jgi:ADP-heptose:LPS heptosyltransferase
MPSLYGLPVRLWSAFVLQPDKIFYANGGIGDELMVTAIAAAARAAGQPIHVIAAYPDFWRGNADPASLQTGVERWHYASLRGWIRTQIIHLGYKTGASGHIAEQMAAHTGIALRAGWRPVFNFSSAAQPAARNPKLIVVQNSCSGARYAAVTKEWPHEHWLALTRRLAQDYRLVQIGTPCDPSLDAVRDLRGKTTLREAARLLAGAALFVGLESGLQHVAAATGTPAIIIYGGRSRPSETGYPFNVNITRAPACAGCGLNSGCPHDLVCMDITVAEVEAAIREKLDALSLRSSCA